MEDITELSVAGFRKKIGIPFFGRRRLETSGGRIFAGA